MAIATFFTNMQHYGYMTSAEKLNFVKGLIEEVLNGYQVDGQFYSHTSVANLTDSDIQDLSLSEIEDYVEKCACGNDLCVDLGKVAQFARDNLFATEAAVIAYDNFVMVDIKFTDQQFVEVYELADLG